MEIVYKNRGFGNYEAWALLKKQAMITSTFGRQSGKGRFRILFTSDKTTTYCSTRIEAERIVAEKLGGTLNG